MKLLEASIVLLAKNDLVTNDTSAAELKLILSESLNKAKEAFSLDRTLHQFRAQYGENIFHNFDLTYAVSLFLPIFQRISFKLLRSFNVYLFTRFSLTWRSNMNAMTCTLRLLTSIAS